MDKLSPAQRSQVMAKIHGRDTGPERLVGRLLSRLGVRFTLHDPQLPGKPDIVVRAAKTAVFVHGCFWHRHRCSRGRSMPSSRRAFWRKKLAMNAIRDQLQARQLRRLGWHVLVVWECQTKRSKAPQLLLRLERLLGRSRVGVQPWRQLARRRVRRRYRSPASRKLKTSLRDTIK